MHGSNHPEAISWRSRFARMVWDITWLVLYRPSPRPFHFWRRFLLRLFGARVGKGVHPYPSSRVWAPWNLELEDYSCLAWQVDCYCVAPIRIGPRATISQYTHLCSAGHDIDRPDMPLLASPIVIGADAWIAAAAFIGPGVRVGEGAVVGASAAVFRDVEPWTVVGGNPARFLRQRRTRTSREAFWRHPDSQASADGDSREVPKPEETTPGAAPVREPASKP